MTEASWAQYTLKLVLGLVSFNLSKISDPVYKIVDLDYKVVFNTVTAITPLFI